MGLRSAALRDHTKPQFSSVQLEAIRLRGSLDENGRAFGTASVHAVFADIRERATALLAAELKESGESSDVGAEMNRVLERLLTSVEQAFSSP